MPWPVDDLSTAGVDSGRDRPPRAEFFKLFQRVKAIIARARHGGRRRLPRRPPPGAGRRARARRGRRPGGARCVRPRAVRATPAAARAGATGAARHRRHVGRRRSAAHGWFNCYGGAISRANFAALFAVIGTTYGAGDGSTTFNVPNMSARFPLARGAGRNRGERGGAATHRLTVDEMPAHAHELGGTRSDGAGANRNKHTGTAGHATTVAAGSDYGVRNTGGGQAHNNMPPYFVINFIIKW